nr:hypothetical protein [Tanacetum cinerariifolium]
MRVDLDVEGAEPASLPRFQRASFQARRLSRLTYVLGAMGVLGLVVSLFVDLFSPNSLWTAVLTNSAASLLVLAAALQSAQVVALWRAHVIAPDEAVISVEEQAEIEEPGWYDRLLGRIGGAGTSMVGQIGAPCRPDGQRGRWSVAADRLWSAGARASVQQRIRSELARSRAVGADQPCGHRYVADRRVLSVLLFCRSQRTAQSLRHRLATDLGVYLHASGVSARDGGDYCPRLGPQRRPRNSNAGPRDLRAFRQTGRGHGTWAAR